MARRQSVAVIIATFGKDVTEWNGYAARALESCTRQRRQPDEVIRIHRATLRQARNAGGRLARTDYLIFLDADDELDPFYIERMLEGSGELRYPKVRYIQPGQKVDDAEPAMLLREKPILTGNWMVIGTMIERSDFLLVKGFDDYPFYEDWALWLKIYAAGARPVPVPEAVYIAHQRPGSRNQPESSESERITYEIANRFREDVNRRIERV